jgi:hypothetical protein
VPMQWLRSLAAFAALAVALLLWAEDADARLEGAPSVGKSAGGTFLMPQVTAPAFAVIAVNDHATAGSSSNPGGSLGGLFSRPGLLGGFAAGFLGSGVLGLLFGHGRPLPACRRGNWPIPTCARVTNFFPTSRRRPRRTTSPPTIIGWSASNFRLWRYCGAGES